MSRQKIALCLLSCLPIASLSLLATQARHQERTPAAPKASAVAKGGKLARQAAVPPAPPERATERRIVQALAKRVSVNWTKMPLKTVVQQIGRLGGFAVLVDDPALKEAGIDSTLPVTLVLNDVALEGVMHFSLTPLGLSWLVDDESLKVTTKEQAAELFVTRVYDTSRLVRLARRWAQHVDEQAIQSGTLHPFDVQWRRTPRLSTWYGQGFFSLQAAGGSDLGGGLPQSCDMPTNGALVNVPDVYSPKQIRKRIRHLLYETGGGVWFENDGGPGGKARFHGDALIVRQTCKEQREIVSFLRALETVVSAEETGRAVQVYQSATNPAGDNDAVHRALLKRINVKSEKRALKLVLQDVARQCGVRLWIDEQGLSHAGVNLDDPVTLSTSNVTARSAWNLILKPFGLGTRVEFGILTVSTREKIEEELYAKVYDVSDLTVATTHGCQNLAELIQKSVSGRFYDVEGVAGRIDDPLPGILVVRHWKSVHDEIAMLLANMRRKLRAAKPQPNRKPVTLDTIETRIYTVLNGQQQDDLLKSIPQFIDPPSWKRLDGGKIGKAGNALIIRQTVRNHIRIVTFLQTVADSNPAPLPDDQSRRKQ